MIKFLRQCLRILPERVQLLVGKALGRLAFLFLRGRRQVALNNIGRVFTDLSRLEIETIARNNFEKLGINATEYLLLPFLRRDHLSERFTVKGRGYFEEAIQSGKGAIALGFHFGNWEVTGLISKLLNREIVALARPLKKHMLLNRFLNDLRETSGLTIIVNENTGKEVMRLLKANKIVAILGDQREKRSHGVFVEFFGTKVPTSKGAAMIGMKTGSPVIPVYAVREGFLRYTFICGRPIEMERKGDIGNLIERNTRKINTFLEEIIKQYPDEWFWVHRRWGRRNKNNDPYANRDTEPTHEMAGPVKTPLIKS